TATSNANHIDIHDSANAIWNRGAARTASCSTTTQSPQTTTCTAGTISARDIGRPVSGPGIFQGGLGDAASSYIKSVVGSTATLTRNCTTAATCPTAAHPLKIEHTRSRIDVTATNPASAA